MANQPDYTGASAQQYINNFTNREQDAGSVISNTWDWLTGRSQSLPKPEDSVVVSPEDNPQIAVKNDNLNNFPMLVNNNNPSYQGGQFVNNAQQSNIQASPSNNTLRDIRSNFNPADPNQVLMVQQMLNEAGYTGKSGQPLKEDSKFGPNSEHAWREFINQDNTKQGKELYRWDDPSPKPQKKPGGLLKKAWRALDDNVFRGTLPGGIDRKEWLKENK